MPLSCGLAERNVRLGLIKFWVLITKGRPNKRVQAITSSIRSYLAPGFHPRLKRGVRWCGSAEKFPVRSIAGMNRPSQQTLLNNSKVSERDKQLYFAISRHALRAWRLLFRSRNAHYTLKWPLCSCVSITLPGSS
jgi:hypothetical protein